MQVLSALAAYRDKAVETDYGRQVPLEEGRLCS